MDASPISLILPAPANLTPFKEHPKTKEILKDSNNWARESLLPLYSSQEALEAFIQQGAVLWICLSYPDAYESRLKLLCRWHQYWFTVDDKTALTSGTTTDPENTIAWYSSIRDMLSGRPVENKSLVPQLVSDIWEEMSALMPMGLQSRIILGIEEMLEGFKDEAMLRVSGAYDTSELLSTRRKSSGLMWCIAFIEYGLGIDLTEELATNPCLSRLSLWVRDQMIYHNEILSFRKEYYSGDTINIVYHWAGSDLCQLQYAVDKANAEATRAEERFILERDAILNGPLNENPNIRLYLEALGHFMSGCLRYQYISPRYHGSEHIWNGSFSGAIKLTPNQTIFLP